MITGIWLTELGKRDRERLEGKWSIEKKMMVAICPTRSGKRQRQIKRDKRTED
jgi:hypothetical protein